MWSDLRHAIRSLARQPAFTVTTLLTLALGIGATSAIFSVVYGVLLRPLPYAHPEQLVRIYEEHPGGRSALGQNWASDLTLAAWQPSMRPMAGVATFSGSVDTVGRSEPERWRAGVVSPSLFSVLRVAPAAGRFFEEREAVEGVGDVVVLSDKVWRDRFGGRADAVGEALWVDGQPFQIVGVAPPGFSFPSPDIQFWRPQTLATPAAGRMRVLAAIGRLAGGVSPAQAAAEGTAAARTVARPPAAQLLFGEGGPVEVRVAGYVDQMTSRVRPALLVLAAGVGFVLLVACANVANLFLSRGVARQRELAVRAALGAGRARLFRQLLTESLLLSAAGGALGVWLAWLLVEALPAVAPASLPRLTEIRLDGPALMFGVVVSLLTGLLSGALPAFRGARTGLASAMADGDVRSTGSVARRLRRGLLVAEAALAVLLLVGTGLLARSFVALAGVDPGYNADKVLMAQVLLPPVAAGDASNSVVAESILSRLQTLPGVVAAGAGNMAPLAPTSAIQMLTLPEIGPDGERITARALAWTVSHGYAEALGLRVRAGRSFTAVDATSPTRAVIVNEEFVRRYWTDGRPVVGRQYEGVFSEKGTLAEVVGVVGNTLKDGLDTRPEPEVYAPARAMAASFSRQMHLAIRTSGDPTALSADLRRVVLEVEPRAALDGVTTLDARVSASVAQPRFLASVLGAFAVTAVLLSAIGLYGVLSYGVAQRRREMGVRTAMGASRRQLVGLILREGLGTVAVGLVAGLAAAAGLARLIESLLFGITPLDARAYAVPPVVMLGVAALACVVPARRAASVDPAEVLRCE